MKRATNLEQMLDQIAAAAREREQVSLDVIADAVGSRSFGPLILMVGIILASPLSGIPGMPTLMAVFVLLVAVQLLLGMKHFWLPRWLLQRSIDSRRLDIALNWLTRPARFVDRLLQPRLTLLVHNAGTCLIAIVCLALAAGLPVMELIPFSATAAGFALTAFGLALVAHDGALALLAMVLTAVTFSLLAASLL